MNSFIKKYKQDNSDTVFTGIIPISNSTDLIIVGSKDNKGFVIRVNVLGQIIWQKTYISDEPNATLYQGYQINKTECLIGGHIYSDTDRRRYWLIRIQISDGKFSKYGFNRKYYSATTRRFIRFILLSKKEFAFAGWNDPRRKFDRTEFLKVNLTGNPTELTELSLSSDDQISTAIPINKDWLAFGGETNYNGWKGLLSFYNFNTKKTLAFGLQHETINQKHNIAAIANINENELLLVSTLGSDGIGEIYLTRCAFIQTNVVFQQSIIANFGWRSSIRKIIVEGNKAYLLGFNRDKKNEHFIALFDLGANANHTILKWVRTFDIKETFVLYDFISQPDGFYISGFLNIPKDRTPLLIKVDREFIGCSLKNIKFKGSTINKHFIAKTGKYKLIDELSKLKNENLSIETIDNNLSIQQICPAVVSEGPLLDKNNLLQSPWIYLQAAGSIGQESVRGIHTRWFLRKELGEKHLPKGDYASKTTDYNRPNDFVKIYRALYHKPTKQFAILNFNTKPTVINHEDPVWVYKSGVDLHTFYIEFLNKLLYSQIQQSINPDNQFFQFIQSYCSAGGLLEIQLPRGLCFKWHLFAHNQLSVQVETDSVEGNISLAEEVLSNRLTFNNVNQKGVEIIGENMLTLRLKVTKGGIGSIHAELYHDFLNNAVDNGYWEKVGDFALTKDDTIALNRLDDASRMNIGSDWDKFNDATKVSIPCYQKKWTGGVNQNSPFPSPDNVVIGIKKGVEKYIQLSQDASNPTARETINEVNHSPSHDIYDSMDIRYLDLLNIVATDYHVARMLGLGYIDTKPKEDTDTYIYLMEYSNTALLEETGRKQFLQHFYMSLPTAPKDQRLPQKVETLPVTYGVDINGGNSYSITDIQGYTPLEPIRFINVFSKIKADYSISNSFFNPSTKFSLEKFTHPVFVGIEYKEKGESNWRTPELSHQQVFGHTETLPLVIHDDLSKPTFIHQEREEGYHQYATYPINIFSRAGQLSNIVATNETQFTIPNTLLPPQNIRVQLIQPENPLMLTSKEEQYVYKDKLDNQMSLPNEKPILLRVTFDYSHFHDINYAVKKANQYYFGEEVEFVFREDAQRILKGGSIINPGNPVPISTKSYTYASTNEIENPEIPVAIQNNFIGGAFIVNGGQFEISQVLQAGIEPIITVLKNEKKEMITDGNGNSSVVQTWEGPVADTKDLFMIQENLKKLESWNNNILSYKVTIGDNWSVKTESYINEDGKTVQRPLRGIWEQATIKMQAGAQLPGTGGTGPGSTPPQYEIIPGYYEIEFVNFQLNHHPQYSPKSYTNLDDNTKTVDWYTGVDWFGGYLRVPLKKHPTKEWKALKVIRIENIGTNHNLKLLAIDEQYAPNSDTEITAFSPNNWGAVPQMEVNFYPGYRVYLEKETSKGFDFDTIYPSVPSTYEKNTLVSAITRAINPNTLSGNYHSDIGAPQTITAEKIIAPAQPQLPSGPKYATPPDLYSKATYTFEITLGQSNPYALIFYRMDLNAVLNALYESTTITQIKRELLAPELDTFFTSRWESLIKVELQTNYTFKLFPTSVGYNFPKPNKAGVFDGINNLNLFKVKVKEVICNAATPILEKPLVYEQIPSDSIPNNKITPNHPALKIGNNNNQVRFTDFSIDGEKITSYFYFAREMGSRNDFSEPSPIAGPIQVINNQPPKAPFVRKITTQLADLITGTTSAVKVEALGFSEYSKIRKVQLYRAIGELDALSIRTMDMVKEVSLDAIQSVSETFEILDDFANDSEVPYGENLYYRLVSLREVNYKKSLNGPLITEYIPSIPTKAFKSGVVDVFNPEPPTITAKFDNTSNPAELQNVVLSWNKTAYKGKYYLFKMNSVGNWTKIPPINDFSDLSYSFPNPLSAEDDGSKIYHRFKITVENQSGLLNLTENILTIPS